MVITKQPAGPVIPTGFNSFWVFHKDGRWFIVTWTPTAYEIPRGTDPRAVCIEFAHHGTSAQHRVPDEMVRCHSLRPLTPAELESAAKDVTSSGPAYDVG
jgi:hypothetical protein